MLPYSYLVLSVNPTSNETNVDLKSKITINFAKPINIDTLNENTIRLKKVNGSFIDYSGQYNFQAKSFTITPSVPLEANTQYQTIVMGGHEGILSIDGGFLPSTKTYEFVTVEAAMVTDLTNLIVSQDYYFVRAEWDMPTGLMTDEEIHFNVRISTSSNPDAVDVWPRNPIEGKTTSTEITIPFRLETGRNYYVHVQGVMDRGETEWLTNQLYMEPVSGSTSAPVAMILSEQTAPSIAAVGDPIAIIEHYPKMHDYQTPSQIMVAFDGILKAGSHIAIVGEWELGVDALIEDLLSDTADEYGSFMYVVKAPYKEKLTVLDIKTTYSPANALPATVKPHPDDPTVLLLEVDNINSFEKGKEYTVVVSKKVSGAEQGYLGYNFAFSFTTFSDHFHGDADKIDETLKNYGITLSLPRLKSLMTKYSQFACDIWTNSAAYDESLHRNGEAPYFIHEYVNIQVIIEGLVNYASSSSISGSEQIQLGDLTVSKQSGNSSGSSISGVVAQLQEQLKAWNDLVHGHRNRGYAKPGSTVKGESVSAYPAPLTRSSLKNFDS